MAWATAVGATQVERLCDIVVDGETGRLARARRVDTPGARVRQVLNPLLPRQRLSTKALERVRSEFAWGHAAERSLGSRTGTRSR